MPCLVSENKYYSNPILLLQLVVKLWAKACLCFLLSIFLIACILFLFLVLLPIFTLLLWAFFLCKILCLFRLFQQFRFLEMKFLINHLSRIATILIGSSSRSRRNKNLSKNSECDLHLHHDESVDHNYEFIAKFLEDKPESVELDPSELPCLYESDFDVEDDHHQEIKGKKGVNIEETGQICTYEQGSWQIVDLKPALREKREPQSFYDVMSYWKSKEKGEEEEEA